MSQSITLPKTSGVRRVNSSGLCLALTIAFLPFATNAATKTKASLSGVVAFNQALDSATREMSNAALLELWDEDGVSLLPSTPPIVGKKAIAKFLDDMMSQLHGGRMEKFEMQCHDIVVSGDWASEWCSEHQVVHLSEDKPPFEGWGKMLLVLHRGAGGKWRLKEEMWNQAVSPSPATP